jgi:hypothetical protein
MKAYHFSIETKLKVLLTKLKVKKLCPRKNDVCKEID